MAEDIVTCPGCAKKFRIPEGAPGGTFACTACNAQVPYGKAAKGAKAAPAAKGGAKAQAPRAPAPAAAPARGSAKRGRREEPEEEPDDRGRRGRGKEKDKSSQTVLWVSVGAVALIAVIGVILMNKKKAEPVPEAPTAPPTAPAQPATTPQPAPVAPTPAAAGPGDPSAAGGAGTAGTAEKPPETSGIGGSKTNVPASAGGSTMYDKLFVKIDDIAGVTPQEREAMDKDVALLCDFDAGKPGLDAGRRLRKLGRKAVPSLLSSFEGQWQKTKWDDDKAKWASFQVQQLLVEIVKADRPGGDFVARYVPQNPASVPAVDFQRAARMWVQWWTGKGKDIEKFKDFAE